MKEYSDFMLDIIEQRIFLDDQREAMINQEIESLEDSGVCLETNRNTGGLINMVDVFENLLSMEMLDGDTEAKLNNCLHSIYKNSPELRRLVDKYIEYTVDHATE